MIMQPALIGADSANPKANKIQGQYIVILSDDSDLQNEIGKAKAKGAEIIQEYQHAIKGFAVKVNNDKILENIKRNNPSISYIEPDYEMKTFAQTIPTGINRIDGDLSSTISGDNKISVNVDIAIIDTGVDLTHPDLNVFKNISFVQGVKKGNDDNGHGTHVAGIAAAKDDSNGVVGVAPGARIWAVKVLDRNGSGSLSNVVKGIDYVTANARDIEVANMSLGCQCNSAAMNTALTNSVAAGVTYVVAAGNDNMDASSFSPANHPDVIAVSAIVDTDGKCGGLGSSTGYGADDTFASFSNFGSTVDIAAPGVNIYSTWKGGSYYTISGTSMASPHVAGAAALYKSTHTGSPADVKASLLSNGSTTSSICDGNGFGYFTGDKDVFSEPLLYVRNY
jgi:subtilisin family serine protease